ncbi:MAG: FHA domain-containing protein [Planctomycetales bacterium]|nr:FHA domain-containing protein [Planctomycetales bacterium]
MASLFVIKGPDQGKRFDLESPVITLGREGANRYRLRDTEVSRRHVEVRRDEEGYSALDLGSSNGTYLNGQRIESARLASGDRLQLGRTVLLFTAQGHQSGVDLSDVVAITGGQQPQGSRILRSMSHEESSDVLAGVSGGAAWLARARSNLQVMYRTALAVSHTLDIDELLARILDLVFEWVEADRGCVMLVDQETGELMPKARRTRKGVNAEERISISRTILDYVMEREEGVLTSDARDDQRFDTAASIVNAGVREAICVPLQGRYGVVGIIYVDTFTPPGQALSGRTANRFADEHLRLMVAIGHQAALAVEDTSYYSAMVHSERLAAVGQAIAALSHHIKNILQGIRGGSYLIEEGLKTEEADVIRSGWRIVEKNQEKISNLVMDMLTFSKERDPEPVDADLNEVVQDVVELMQVRADEMQVALTYRPDASLPRLRFDPDSVHRAVLNVLTNAIDACREAEQGRVDVSTAFDAASGCAKVIIADNGGGIDEEELPRIFRMFVSSKGHRGTGLGLPVSQKIMREHGGDIDVESTPGEGSRFILRLPAAASAAAEQGSGRGTSAGDATHQII